MKLGKSDKQKIIEAITQAEKNTTGEIVVHISHKNDSRSPIVCAQEIFFKMGLDQTQERNGVLLYFNPRKRVFALYGDSGIHEKLGASYWESMVHEVRNQITNQDLIAGILLGVEELGKQLNTYFPGSPTDQNELGNEPSEDF